MPKKAVEMTNIINIRISDEQKKAWNEYLDNHKEFSSVSNFVRYCVTEMIEGITPNADNKKLKEKVRKIDEKYEKLMEFKHDMLKIIAQKTQHEKPDLKEYQKAVIENLIAEKPRNEVELTKLIPKITEAEVLSIIYELREATIIELHENKYRMRKI